MSKSPSKAKKAKRAEPRKATKAAAPAKECAEPQIHGIDAVMGDMKDGGSSKKPLTMVVPLSALRPDKVKPRAEIGDVTELANSIRAEGVIQSLLVRPSKTKGVFDIISGQRRFAAMQSIKYDRLVPINVRTDLVGDDERSKAVAVAENSPDGRTNLTDIELGRTLKELEAKDWTVERMARECSLHSQKVRRCLKLMESSRPILERVEKGTMTMGAALEIQRISDEDRADVEKALAEQPEVGEKEVRAVRVQLATEAREAAATTGDGEAVPTTRRGTVARRDVSAWMGSRVKQPVIEELAYMVAHPDEFQIKQDDAGYVEARAILWYALWDRGSFGDVTFELPPAPDADKSDDPATTRKLLALFDTLTKHAAAQFDERRKAAAAAVDGADGDDGATKATKAAAKKAVPKKAKAAKPAAKKAKPAKKAKRVMQAA